MESKKTYTREFKIETVKLITDGGASAAQIANDLEIRLNTLYEWIKEFSSKQEEVYPGKGHLTTDARIINRLKRENEQLKQELDRIETAKAISKDPS